jgi:antitoxin component YwqK of YwqJK toxin-antitoxin module
VTFFPNGKIRYVGEYKDDEKSGNWKFYDEAGLLISEENY